MNISPASPVSPANAAPVPAANLAQFSADVLKASLAFQASTADQLVQMINQGSGIDISA
jgi:hypothetical protein